MKRAFRDKVVTALTDGSICRAKGKLFDGYADDGRPCLCALGAILHVAGFLPFVLAGVPGYRKAMQLIGQPGRPAEEIWGRSDSKGFQSVADYIQTLPLED